MSAPLLGIDVGGSKLAGIVVRGDEIVASRRRVREPESLDRQVLALARDLQAQAGPVAAIGVAIPGQVDVAAGVVELAVNLGVESLAIGPLLSVELGVPCGVEHDARAVAAWLAERPGAPAHLAYLNVGTGISAGVVVDRRLLRGVAGLAGEVGHLLADPTAGRCACGLTGCLETVASGPAVERLAAAAANGRDGDLRAADVYAAAAHDATARAIVQRAARHLAAAIRGLALAYGVSRVIVGGGVTRAGAPFTVPLRAALDRERAASALVARALPADAVEVLGDDQPWGALGASAVARRALEPIGSSSEEEVGLR